ncbi:MAG TPA: glycosyltransferase [Candidatus Desulfobacillus sp.]|nr:glycosyltransferase [Candidatus Desulfobacillus sp.]
MIFVTVGSMMPFDRLVAAADAWAAASGREAFAQIGEGRYLPRHMEYTRRLAPGAFAARLRVAELIVAHAGMGSVISALEAGKPIVVMPRRSADREVTTDHQLHTTKWLTGKPGVHVAANEDDLAAAIERALAELARNEGRPPPLPQAAQAEFLARVRGFLEG